MKKEILTKENIKEDLLRAEKLRRSIRHSVRCAYYFPCILIALIISFLFKSMIFALPFAAVAIYHIVQRQAF